jgi:hypothetical protein
MQRRSPQREPREMKKLQMHQQLVVVQFVLDQWFEKVKKYLL